MPNPPDSRHIRLEQTDAGFLARLIDCHSLDEQTTGAIETELSALAEQLGAAPLILDLSGIGFISSTGLGMLIRLNRQLKASGGHLTVVGVSDVVYEVIEVTGLNHLLDVRRDRPAPNEPFRGDQLFL